MKASSGSIAASVGDTMCGRPCNGLNPVSRWSKWALHGVQRDEPVLREYRINDISTTISGTMRLAAHVDEQEDTRRAA